MASTSSAPDPSPNTLESPKDFIPYMQYFNDFYKRVFVNPDMFPPSDKFIFSAESGLQDAPGIFERFKKRDLNWYHLLLRQQEFGRFMDEMKEYKDKVASLPYGCLCSALKEDGIDSDDDDPENEAAAKEFDCPILRDLKCPPHRHLLLACDKSVPFETVWTEKMGHPMPGRKDAKGITRCVKIRKTIQLAKTIQHVNMIEHDDEGCSQGILSDLR